MHYLVYFPEESSSRDRSKLGALLADSDPDPDWYPVTSGPDNSAGIICVPHVVTLGEGFRPGYFPDDQIWHHDVKHGRWIGWQADNPPTPENLQRQTTFDGIESGLADGNSWLIPNWFDQRHTIDIDDNGKPFKAFTYKYDGEYQSALIMLEMIETEFKREIISLDNQKRSGDGEELLPLPKSTWSFDTVWNYCVDMLARNYRVDAFIVAKLGLLDETRLGSLIAIATDFERIQRLDEELREKKSTALN